MTESVQGLRINFSDKEAKAEGRSVEPLPRGDYHVKLTDVEVQFVSSANTNGNAGKPFWNLEFTVQDGKYTDRKLWTSCMLFEGALYTLSQLLKATGYEIPAGGGDFTLPDADEMIGRDMIVGVTIQAERKDGDKTYAARNDVKSIRAFVEGGVATPSAAGGKATGKSSLLP